VWDHGGLVRARAREERSPRAGTSLGVSLGVVGEPLGRIFGVASEVVGVVLWGHEGEGRGRQGRLTT
jgi:hypothetical protein